MDIRSSPIAGTWYPNDPHALAQTVDKFIADATLPALEGRPIAVISPHAGLTFSGAVAAHSFNALRDLRPEIVVVIGPMHHAHSAPLLTSGHEAFETPLGLVRIDKRSIDQIHLALKESLGFGLTKVRDDPEHSIEIELPFLQRLLGGFTLVPIMMVNQHLPVANAVGNALAEVLSDRESVLVASSDLSHYFPQETANDFDWEILHRIERFDADGVVQAHDEGVCYACGRGAISAVMIAAKALGADRVSVLKYATSGDVTGDYSSVVGYAAATITTQPQ